MRKAILLFDLVVMFCMGIMPGQVRSANEDPPLLVTLAIEPHQHVLYQYINAEWNIVPADGFYAGSLSPDGEHLAYLRVPPFLRALIDDGKNWLSGTARNITVMSLHDGSSRDIAVQPTTITTTADGYTGGLKRSLPVWSPDGSALAWTEQDYPALNEARLIVYDLNSDTSRILDDALPQMTLSADGLPDLLNWGQPGIVVFTNDPPDYAETLRFYDVTAGTMQMVRLPDDGLEWYPIVGPLWVANTQAEAGDDVAVVQADRYVWYRVDPASGDVTALDAPLELVGTSNPVESLQLVGNINADANTPAWQLLAADKTTLLTWSDPLASGAGVELTQLVIAPSGQAAAYLEGGKLTLWQGGTAAEITPPDGLLITALDWGPTRWQFGAPYDTPSQDGE